jgi:hypothetical protein
MNARNAAMMHSPQTIAIKMLTSVALMAWIVP